MNLLNVYRYKSIAVFVVCYPLFVVRILKAINEQQVTNN
ncbi:hypothetical protein CLV24_106110 [Pontibacter ummariensis]|uniref:Uncharacterized protein n=1 Tax=Pontibacter ummariensis TaxID=1610492 RepID=A0A239ED98_9BACT|nr:hypothetical protein CLV24_106110 [Pontibacter ummariensis]SNS42489.1 hypothetical protein SAMN06296052_106110 [Pontibacter ummariensis]